MFEYTGRLGRPGDGWQARYKAEGRASLAAKRFGKDVAAVALPVLAGSDNVTAEVLCLATARTEDPAVVSTGRAAAALALWIGEEFAATNRTGREGPRRPSGDSAGVTSSGSGGWVSAGGRISGAGEDRLLALCSRLGGLHTAGERRSERIRVRDLLDRPPPKAGRGSSACRAGGNSCTLGGPGMAPGGDGAGTGDSAELAAQPGRLTSAPVGLAAANPGAVGFVPGPGRGRPRSCPPRDDEGVRQLKGRHA